jgi:hypothetical protein
MATKLDKFSILHALPAADAHKIQRPLADRLLNDVAARSTACPAMTAIADLRWSALQSEQSHLAGQVLARNRPAGPT